MGELQRQGAGGREAGTLWMVQWLRAAAALMVVVGHSQSAVARVALDGGRTFERSALLPWGAGVDLFFVISGFIMVHASTRLFARPGASGTFLARRLARIVPLYWLTTTAFLLLLGAASLKGGDAFPSAPAIIASYLFWPFDAHGDGRAFPVFDLGWTLNYEMAFYVLFAVAVMLPRRRAVATIVLALVVLVLVGEGVPARWTAVRFWSRPIVLDFALGLGVGLAAAERIVLPALLRLALAAGGIALLCADPGHVFNGPLGTTVANGWPRVLLAGVPAAVALAGAVLGPSPRVHGAFRPLGALGDASYSLYLLHPFALIAMEKLVQKSAAVRSLDGSLLVVATVAAAIALALASYRTVERPVARLFHPRGRVTAEPTVMPRHQGARP